MNLFQLLSFQITKNLDKFLDFIVEINELQQTGLLIDE